MSKTFATETITNELKGSAWFKRPQTPKKSTKKKPTATKKTASRKQAKPVAKKKATQTQPVSSSGKRVRRAFDLDETQVDNLFRLRATRELAQKARVSTSELVREAIDLLLDKEKIQ